MIDPATIQAGASLLTALTGASGANKAPVPGNAFSGMGPSVINSDADFSGFTVATQGARSSGANIDKTASNGVGTPSQSIAAVLGDIPPWLLIGGAVALAVVWKLAR